MPGRNKMSDKKAQVLTLDPPVDLVFKGKDREVCIN